MGLRACNIYFAEITKGLRVSISGPFIFGAAVDILMFHGPMVTQAKISGRYEIKEPLGQGGMGVVYRAYDTTTKRDVAVKTMRGIADPAALELFAKEWGVLATLCHPNIVDILDTGEFEEEGQRKPYFVMP